MCAVGTRTVKSNAKNKISFANTSHDAGGVLQKTMVYTLYNLLFKLRKTAFCTQEAYPGTFTLFTKVLSFYFIF